MLEGAGEHFGGAVRGAVFATGDDDAVAPQGGSGGDEPGGHAGDGFPGGSLRIEVEDIAGEAGMAFP